MQTQILLPPTYKNTYATHCSHTTTPPKTFNQMKTLNTLACLTYFLTIFITFSQSNAEQSQPNTTILETDQFLNKVANLSHHQTQLQEPTLKLATPTLLAGLLCFIGASISSAGGIGGGGLFIPILTIVAGLDLKTASSFSAFMVTGGSIANVMYNLFSHNGGGGKALINYGIVLLSEPCMLLGVSVGVICNIVFPDWLITVVFVVFLTWTTFKTCMNGVLHWRMESKEVKRNGCENLGCLLGNEGFSIASEVAESNKEPLLCMKLENRLNFPLQKLGITLLIWLSFSLLYLLRGYRYREGIAPLKPCGVEYWVLSSLQIPLAIIFTAWILQRKHKYQNQQDMEDSTRHRMSNRFIFPIMSLLAGILGGAFGIGGGMLINPLLLQVGISPEETAATSSFMVFFSSTMSAFQYLLSGMEDTETALILGAMCLIASLIGMVVIKRTIKEYGRGSIIVFLVGIVMGLSTVLISSFEAIDVWRDYKSGNNMGFKFPC